MTTLEKAAEVFGTTPQAILSHDRDRNTLFARYTMYAVMKDCGDSINQIATFFDRSSTNQIATGIHELYRNLHFDKDLNVKAREVLNHAKLVVG